MRARARIIIIIAAFILQPLLSSMLPEWLAPNLILCLLIVMGVTLEPDDLVVPASVLFAVSLLGDMYYSQYVGVSVICMVVTLLFLLGIRRTANIENSIFALAVVIGANIIYYVCYWLIYVVLSSPYSFIYMITRLPGMIFANVIVSFICLIIITRDTIQKRRDNYFR